MSAVEHGFKAEVQQLLDLMIHSVYSDREVFLRELVSNAADALDKARFLALTRSDLAPAANDPQGVRITPIGALRQITIEDDGIGMTMQEVIDNLGTIARSGTKEFVNQLKQAGQAGAPKMIGQFGVGFYSAFIVAEEVEVITRSALPGEKGVRWKSTGNGNFTVEEADKEHRGTRIILKLRDEAKEYADPIMLKEIVKKHSNYMPWPIFVEAEQANAAKALWAEQPSKVTDEEANGFYRNLTGDWREPALRIHTTVDSPIQWSALLFVPENRPYDLFNPRAERGPRLYARRVLIAEHANELLPDWLRFVQGVVDSEDIPLNVSREMVQKTAVVRKLKDAITKRVLKDLGKFADAPVDPEKSAAKTWASVWSEFGVLLKEGYSTSHEHRELLLPLLRFHTRNHGDEVVSLATYKKEMPEGQDTIWYIAAESKDAALLSPHLEAFKKRGWDVLICHEPVDEWLMNSLETFEETPVKSATRGELPADPAEEADKAKLDGLVPWLETMFAGAVKQVRASGRLTDSAAVLVDDDTGISSNMERILRAANQPMPGGKRILELNPGHPLIKNLVALHDAGKNADVEPIARLLLDDAQLLEGAIKDPAGVGKRLQDLLVRASASALRETPAT